MHGVREIQPQAAGASSFMTLLQLCVDMKNCDIVMSAGTGKRRVVGFLAGALLPDHTLRETLVAQGWRFVRYENEVLPLPRDWFRVPRVERWHHDTAGMQLPDWPAPGDDTYYIRTQY